MRVGGQLHAPAALPPGKRPSTHCIRCWVGPRADLDSCGKSRPHRDSAPDRPARSESLYRLSYPRRKYYKFYNTILVSSFSAPANSQGQKGLCSFCLQMEHRCKLESWSQCILCVFLKMQVNLTALCLPSSTYTSLNKFLHRPMHY
jgi:hypothetical protein